jgi:mRNA-degrading endonuclease HigB of HigAB toxin-antitoxin module
MANTKVTGDLIAGGTITTFNLADGSVTAAKLNSITTDNISEGTNLFYTDARVATYLSGNGYDTATNIIATITDSAPTTLDTLNELAAALGDDPNFATTVTNSIATKLPLAGGTIAGNLTVSGSLTGTLATAAQTNITSVGTLSSLAVSGDITIGEYLSGGDGELLVGQDASSYYLFAGFGANVNKPIRIGDNPSHIEIHTANQERMRITSGGYSKITQDGTFYSLSGGYHEITKNGAGTTLVVANKGPSSMGLYYAEFTNAAPNSSSSTFFYGRDSIGPKIIIESSGNIVNTNNSYGPLSDIKLKENIVDTTPKLDKLMDVRIVNYNLIGDDLKQIGVVAQELEQVFPGLVSEHPDYEKVTTVDEEGNEVTENVETGETTKSVKMSVFVPMLIKAMQELKQIVDNQQQQINDLKAQLNG